MRGWVILNKYEGSDLGLTQIRDDWIYDYAQFFSYHHNNASQEPGLRKRLDCKQQSLRGKEYSALWVGLYLWMWVDIARIIYMFGYPRYSNRHRVEWGRVYAIILDHLEGSCLASVATFVNYFRLSQEGRTDKLFLHVSNALHSGITFNIFPSPSICSCFTVNIA